MPPTACLRFALFCLDRRAQQDKDRSQPETEKRDRVCVKKSLLPKSGSTSVSQSSFPTPHPVPSKPLSLAQSFQMLKSISLLLRPFTGTRNKSLGDLEGLAPLL